MATKDEVRDARDARDKLEVEYDDLIEQRAAELNQNAADFAAANAATETKYATLITDKKTEQALAESDFETKIKGLV